MDTAIPEIYTLSLHDALPILGLAEICEQASIIDSNSRLMAESHEQVAVFGAKQIGVDTAIYIDRSDTVLAYYQRCANDGANAIGDNALLRFHLNLCIIGQERLTCAYYALDGTDAEFELIAVNGAGKFIARDFKSQLFRDWMNQYQKATFRIDDANDLIHHQAQHFIKFQGRVEDTGDFVQGFQFAALPFQIVNACIEGFPFALETANSRSRRVREL